MNKSGLIITFFALLLFLFMLMLELIKKEKIKMLINASSRYLTILWFSLIACLFFCFFRQVTASESSFLLKAVTLILLIASEYLLVVYMLFRGMYVLFAVSKEGLEHPTILTIKKLTKNRIIAYICITIIILIFNVGDIYALFHS